MVIGNLLPALRVFSASSEVIGQLKQQLSNAIVKVDVPSEGLTVQHYLISAPGARLLLPNYQSEYQILERTALIRRTLENTDKEIL